MSGMTRERILEICGTHRVLLMVPHLEKMQCNHFVVHKPQIWISCTLENGEVMEICVDTSLFRCMYDHREESMAPDKYDSGIALIDGRMFECICTTDVGKKTYTELMVKALDDRYYI